MIIAISNYPDQAARTVFATNELIDPILLDEFQKHQSTFSSAKV